jgi:hypothetical protein
VVFLALCPLILSLTGSWMRTANANEVRGQADWHSAQATLLQPVPGPQQFDHSANTWITWVQATWTDAGLVHKGDIPAVAGSRAGMHVTIWLDSGGRVHTPPLTPGQEGSRVLEARVAGLAVLAVLLAIMIILLRRLLDRRRLAGWESAWLSVGPTWSRHR